MGRRADPEVQKKRLEAARLEREEGLNAAQIGKRMGASKRTVQEWLQKVRGPKQAVHGEDVVALLREGKSLKEIAKEVGVTDRRVRQILEKMGEYEPGPWTRSSERVPTYVEDPEQYRWTYWSVTATFGHELNFYCKTRVNHDPEGAGKVVGVAIEHFSVLLALRRSEKAKRVTRCQLVQAQGIQAARCRAVEDFDGALERLMAARNTAEECPACDADLCRREAHVLRDAGRHSEALEKVRSAADFYRGSDTQGHDLNKNGLASCALVEAELLDRTGRPDLAIPLIESVLPTVSPESEDLYVGLWLGLTICVYKRRDPREIERAAQVCDEHRNAERFKSRQQPSVIWVKLTWARAKIYEVEGNVPAAINLLLDALEEVRALKLPAGMAAIGADLGRLDPDSFRRRLDDFAEWEWDENEAPADIDWEKAVSEKKLPEWLEPLRELLDRVKFLATVDVSSAARRLRAAGNRFLPDFA